MTGVFITLILLMAALVGVSIWVVREITQGADRRLVDEAIPLVRETQGLVLGMVNQETGVRGYVLSGDADALVPFVAGRREARQAILRLEAVSGSGGIAAALRDTEARIGDLDAFFARQVELVRQGAAGQLVATGRVTLGRGLFDRFRASADRLVARSEAVVAAARRAQDDLTDRLTLALIALGGLALAIAIALAILVPRRMGRLIDDLADERRATAREAAAADEARRLLEAVIDGAPTGVALFDADARFLRVNRSLADINGVAPADHAGRTLAEIVPDVPESGHLEPIRSVLASADPVTDLEVTGRTAADPNRDHHWLASYFPVPGPHGQKAAGVGAVVLDITERKEAEGRLAVLSDAGLALDSALGAEARLDQLAKTLVPVMVDACVVVLVGPDGRLAPGGLAHTDGRGRATLLDLVPRLGELPAPLVRMLLEGPARLVPEITPGMRGAVTRNAAERAALEALDLRSALVVPLRARGRARGLMVLAVAGDRRRLDGADLRFAEEIGRRAALAVDNALLYERQRLIAETLQQSLLPPELPEVPGVELGARYRAGGEGYEVGGDFYDVFQVDEGAWICVVGDACGKGPQAAALTALARYTIRAVALRERDPAAILAELNRAILRQRDDGRFLTCVCARLAPGTEGVTMTLARAGHPRPLVVRADGAVERLGPPGGLLGVLPDVTSATGTWRLRPGDACIAYTDGLSEARRGVEMLGEDRLAAVAAATAGWAAAEVASRIEAAAIDFASGTLSDDVAVLVIRALPAADGFAADRVGEARPAPVPGR